MKFDESKNLWFVSDTHFNHQRLVESCPFHFEEIRKYKTVFEMNEDIITKWNENIKADDTVIFLGDFMLGIPVDKAEAYFKEKYNALNGNKIFIQGNHDNTIIKKELVFVYPFVDIEWKGKVIHCQHYPFDKSVLASDEIYVHGHTHSKIPFENNQNNVSWEAWYRPVNIEELSPVSKEN